MEEHVQQILGASTAVAAPTDVANLLREGSTLVPTPSTEARPDSYLADASPESLHIEDESSTDAEVVAQEELERVFADAGGAQI